MAKGETSSGAMPTHNQAGCPYLNQTGREAVKDWARVLARIDLSALLPELQVELRHLQLGYAGADPSTPTR